MSDRLPGAGRTPKKRMQSAAVDLATQAVNDWRYRAVTISWVDRAGKRFGLRFVREDLVDQDQPVVHPKDPLELP